MPLDPCAKIEFHVHNPIQPILDAWGKFDFVVCRGQTAQVDDPSRLAANLAHALDPAGLLYLPLPSRAAS